jgi:hypothetical protein
VPARTRARARERDREREREKEKGKDKGKRKGKGKGKGKAKGKAKASEALASKTHSGKICPRLPTWPPRQDIPQASQPARSTGKGKARQQRQDAQGQGACGQAR